MIVLKKVFVLFFVLSLICIKPISYVEQTLIANSNASVVQTGKIIIDAGHGGFDGGASSDDGTLEKDINLKIALKLRELCKLGGFQVIMTRESDIGTEIDENDSISNRKKSDMQRRLAIIEENPDAIFVSIHLNKFSASSAQGAQVFYSKNNNDSELLAKSVQNTIIKFIQNQNTRQVKKADSSIFLLKKSHIPSIIVECGFLSNPSELNLLKNSEYQSKMAFSIYCGILKYYVRS